MYSSLEHIDACLPVTALKALVLRGVRLLIQGRGPYCQVIDEQSGKLLSELKTFRRNNIHGFILLNQKQRDPECPYSRLVVWGGSSLRVVDLSLDSKDASGDNGASLRAATAEYLAPDWILAGCASDVENKAERAYVVTAHNTILGLHVVENGRSRFSHTLHIQQLVTGVKSILFSADTIPLSSSHILIAAGTVFGEIIVWSCFVDENESNPLTLNATGSIHHFFTGHEGSIFGVRISPLVNSLPGHKSGRLLASCSDDRTVRIWNISDCEHVSCHDPSAYSTDGFELRTTGFGAVTASGNETGSESCVAKAFGHAARIWGVHFVPATAGDQSKLTIVSRGEDAKCILWDLDWGTSATSKPNFKLTQISSSHLHTGKHLWSLEVINTGTQTTIYTGGADGAVRSFAIDVDEKALVLLPNRDNRITASSDSQNAISIKDKSFKAFAFISPDCFVATTFQGEIQLGSIRSEPNTGPLIFKETLSVEEDLRVFSVIASLPQKGLALIANAHGLVRLYTHGTRSLDKVAQADGRPLRLFPLRYDTDAQSATGALSFVTSYATLRKADLFQVKLSNDEPHVIKTELSLPHGMEVSCASWIFDQYLALGIKSGALLVYKITETGRSLEPILCTLRVHARDGVNEITKFSSVFGETDSSPDYFMTCGRDGDYCIHELEVVEELEVRLHTIHRSSPAVSFNVEGFYVDRVSHDFMLYGFQSTEFVLWNETAHSELARIDCGGARRMWAFHPSYEVSGAGLLLWSQSGFNALQVQPNINRAIRAGGHGREIKTMEVSHSTPERGTLVATGAEDTHLRIFTPAYPRTESPWASFKCLRVLRDHTAGVQQIRWSTDGKTLFSSAGFEELFVWKVRQIPSFGLATALAASSPKDDPTSELRVTSFDVLEVEEEQAACGFLLCLTLSNSTIKIFHYSPLVDGGRFTLLAHGTYTSNCLTQARFLVTDSSIGLITASTDGHFTLWHLTPVLEPFYSMTSTTFCLKQPLETLPISPLNITCEHRYQIHSNSIKALEMARISAVTSLILAGGDDNALTLSLLTVDFTNTDAGSHVCTVTVPDAHAASVTTIKILKQHQLDSEGKTQFIFASSGNDHRVKVWWAEVNPTESGTDGIKVKNLVDQYSSVADISSLDMVTDESGVQLLVCGVGMELFRVQLL